MGSGSAKYHDSLLITMGGDGASILMTIDYFAFGIKKQIKKKPGDLSIDGRSLTANVRDRGLPDSDPAGDQ
jgi:hypothetical protein